MRKNVQSTITYTIHKAKPDRRKVIALIFENQQKFWHWEQYRFIDGNFVAAPYIDEHDPIWQRANPTQSRIDIFAC
jgi:hypothetical protein